MNDLETLQTLTYKTILLINIFHALARDCILQVLKQKIQVNARLAGVNPAN